MIVAIGNSPKPYGREYPLFGFLLQIYKFHRKKFVFYTIYCGGLPQVVQLTMYKDPCKFSILLSSPSSHRLLYITPPVVEIAWNEFDPFPAMLQKKIRRLFMSPIRFQYQL